MDWKEKLGQLLDNPDLPAGEDIPAPQSTQNSAPKDKLRVSVDRKGRKGKIATIVEGFTCSDDEVARIAATLKRRLGVGGSSRDGEILIQGNLADQVRDILRENGFKVI